MALFIGIDSETREHRISQVCLRSKQSCFASAVYHASNVVVFILGTQLSLVYSLGLDLEHNKQTRKQTRTEYFVFLPGTCRNISFLSAVRVGTGVCDPT